jgi:predicted transcriptional regulator
MMVAMVRKQVLVQLDDGQIASLDLLADASEESRSELIRRAIDLYVEATSQGVSDVRYAEAYERTPEDLDEFAALRAIASWPEG